MRLDLRRSWDLTAIILLSIILILFIALLPDNAMRLALGLPFIRTSVDHGTAFDIAGRGIANPESLIEAIKTAVRLAEMSR